MKSAILAAALSLMLAGPCHAANLVSNGQLTVPGSSAVVVVCTDPVMQRVLQEDFAALKRASGAETTTLTVTVHQKLLQPGVSLGDLSPGDAAGVAAMIKAAGGQVPALADTGNSESDPYSNAATINATRPSGGIIDEINRASNNLNQLGTFPSYHPKDPSPYDNLAADDIYDTAIVIRVVASGGRGEMTMVAVTHPREDTREMKKLIAEKIANEILR